MGDKGCIGSTEPALASWEVKTQEFHLTELKPPFLHIVVPAQSRRNISWLNF